MYFFSLQIRLLLLSPSVFVASPLLLLLLLSASKHCYPVVSFAYRTFDVWPHRRCHVVVFLRRRNRPLLFFAFFRVVRGEVGGGVGGGYLPAAISGFIRRIISLLFPPLSLSSSPRSRWRPPAAATAPRKRLGGGGSSGVASSSHCQGRT